MNILAGLTIAVFFLLVVFPVLVNFFGLPPISLPQEIVNVITDDRIVTLFNSVYFLIPLNFILLCFIVRLTVRRFDMIMDLINWIKGLFVR